MEVSRIFKLCYLSHQPNWCSFWIRNRGEHPRHLSTKRHESRPRRLLLVHLKRGQHLPAILKQGTLVVDRHLDHWKARDLRKSMLAMTPINVFDVLLVDHSVQKDKLWGIVSLLLYIYMIPTARQALAYNKMHYIVMRRRYVRDVCWRVQCRCPSEKQPYGKSVQRWDGDHGNAPGSNTGS